MQRDGAALRGEKRRAQVFERCLAASEQAAERDEAKITRLRLRCPPVQGVEHRRAENLRDEIVGARERLGGIDIDRPEVPQMLGLGGARSLVWPQFRVALNARSAGA